MTRWSSWDIAKWDNCSFLPAHNKTATESGNVPYRVSCGQHMINKTAYSTTVTDSNLEENLYEPFLPGSWVNARRVGECIWCHIGQSVSRGLDCRHSTQKAISNQYSLFLLLQPHDSTKELEPFTGQTSVWLSYCPTSQRSTAAACVCILDWCCCWQQCYMLARLRQRYSRTLQLIWSQQCENH